MKKILLSLLAYMTALATNAQSFVKDNYQKVEYDIPVRDGVKLHTIVYSPNDASATNTYPFLMQRTCYSVAPYGADVYPAQVGPSATLMRDKYILCIRTCGAAGRRKAPGPT